MILIGQLEDCRKQMVEMRNLIKKKDEALNGFDDRKVTIEILIYKIQMLGDQMKKDREKMNRVHKEDVEKYEREVYNMMNQIRNMNFELSKKGRIAVNRSVDPTVLKVPSSDQDPEEGMELKTNQKGEPSSRYMIKNGPPLTSTRSNIYSGDPSNRVRPITAHRLMKKTKSPAPNQESSRLSRLFTRRSQSKPAIKAAYIAM